MIPVMCIIQEGQVSADAKLGLKAQISAFTHRSFAAPADIDWIVVPKGSGFTAAEPSTTVIASLHANRPVPDEERIALLKELGEICMSRTGLSADEVVTSIRDPKV